MLTSISVVLTCLLTTNTGLSALDVWKSSSWSDVRQEVTLVARKEPKAVKASELGRALAASLLLSDGNDLKLTNLQLGSHDYALERLALVKSKDASLKLLQGIWLVSLSSKLMPSDFSKAKKTPISVIQNGKKVTQYLYTFDQPDERGVLGKDWMKEAVSEMPMSPFKVYGQISIGHKLPATGVGSLVWATKKAQGPLKWVFLRRINKLDSAAAAANGFVEEWRRVAKAEKDSVYMQYLLARKD